MEEKDELQPVNEPEVKFKLVSGRDTMNVISKEVNETLIEISGYDLQINFNMKYLKSVEDIEAACQGIANLFRQTIMDKLLDANKLKD